MNNTQIKLHKIKQWVEDELILRLYGNPPKLLRLLREHPEFSRTSMLAKNNIAYSSVIAWDKFGSHSRYSERRVSGELLGWRYVDGQYQSFCLSRPELANWGIKTVEDCEVDISEINGFSNSKSDIETFVSIDEMAETKCRKLIDEITQKNLEKNLAHDEIRIIHRQPNSPDYFEVCEWDKRVFLMNDGGSHHFAAAIYIAKRLGLKVPVKGKLHRRRIQKDAVKLLLHDFEIFSVRDSAALYLKFFAAMEQFRATWLWARMPDPYTENMRAIFLPKNNKCSMCVADKLQEAGAFNVGNHLSYLCDLQ